MAAGFDTVHAWRLLLVVAALAVAAVWPTAGGGTRAASPPAELISTEDGLTQLPTLDREPSISGDGDIVVFTARAPFDDGGGATTTTPSSSTTSTATSTTSTTTSSSSATTSTTEPGIVVKALPAASIAVAAGTTQVFVRDRSTGITAAVPLPAGGIESTGGVVSRDGCHIAYWASSQPATGASTNWYLYRWNRCATIPVAERATPGAPWLTNLGAIAISADGRSIAYSARQYGGLLAVAVIDVDAHTERSLPGTFTGPGPGGVAEHLDISDDGSVVTFDEMGAGGSAVGSWDLPSDDRSQIGDGDDPSLSADGRYVAYASGGAGVVADRATGDHRAFASSAGDAEITPDGMQVAFTSYDPHGTPTGVHVARSTAGFFDTIATELVSFGTDDTAVAAAQPTISATGRFLAFVSPEAALLGAPAPVAGLDVWLRERPAALSTGAEVAFGSVTIGTLAGPMSITVTNTSNVSVQIDDVASPAAPFAVATDGCSGVTLVPAAACTMTVTFTPGSPGDAAASVTITGDGATATTSLHGAGITPGALILTPAAHDFGSGVAGTSFPAATFTVTNTGGSATGVTAVGLAGTGADQFDLLADTCTATMLPTTASCTFEVSSVVTRAGPQQSAILVSGSNGQTLSAALLVTGAAAPPEVTPTPPPPPLPTTAPTPPPTTAPPTPTPVFTPTIVMNPGVVRPGQVTTAVGSGFPPGATVQLAFSGEAPFAVTTADAAGAFRAPMLILRNAPRVGPYEVLALDQPQFSGVRAPLLVDLASFQPSGANDAGVTNGLRALYGRGG